MNKKALEEVLSTMFLLYDTERTISFLYTYIIFYVVSTYLTAIDGQGFSIR